MHAFDSRAGSATRQYRDRPLRCETEPVCGNPAPEPGTRGNAPVRSARPRERPDGVPDSFARVSAPSRGGRGSRDPRFKLAKPARLAISYLSVPIAGKGLGSVPLALHPRSAGMLLPHRQCLATETLPKQMKGVALSLDNPYVSRKSHSLPRTHRSADSFPSSMAYSYDSTSTGDLFHIRLPLWRD